MFVLESAAELALLKESCIDIGTVIFEYVDQIVCDDAGLGGQD